MAINNLGEKMKNLLLNSGASLVGYADLNELGSNITDNFNYGVSIAVKMSPTIIKGISNGPTVDYYKEYERVNYLLTELVNEGCNLLNEYGYKAIGQTTTVYTIDGNLRTLLPHKTVATRAGIGWIGKSALLVTKEYGSAIRISSILTNAPLECDTPIDYSECHNCNMCTTECRGNAIKGIEWDIHKDRDELIDANMCRSYARGEASKIGLDGAFCGKCIEVCPYTQKYTYGNLQ